MDNYMNNYMSTQVPYKGILMHTMELKIEALGTILLKYLGDKIIWGSHSSVVCWTTDLEVK